MADERRGIRIKAGKHKAFFTPDDMTGRDVRDFRNEVGFPPRAAFSDPDRLDLDVIAAFLWLERRKTKPALSYDEVLDGISYDNVQVDFGATDEADEDDPER